MVTTEKQLKQWEKAPIRFKAEIERLEEELYQEFLRRKNSPSIYTRFEIGTPDFEKAHQGELNFYQLWTRVIKMQTAALQEEQPKAKIIPFIVKNPGSL